ncbi:DGQHR domain-containing protein [Paenibacillus hunanensis]|uniref:DGQHR domain-containing protein n=1 Tax=Paenibacillus hunanensis TaxID=539262 RepID=UPI002A69AB5D|nr:DGQHR domain-containing protein [Paenibacillus hunanensis]WPP40713.1 DGQHR domain-containing protein [Paenibacillus hunanensis]
MNKSFIKLNQEHFTLYSVSFNVEELINNTKVHYYNSDTNEGYQRPLVPSHYKKIAKYLQENTNPILPTAILTAIDPEYIEEGGGLLIKETLRVVDGQHRIEGMRYLKETNLSAFQRIANYDFPVLIMAISEEHKMYEINAFIDINKKGKPVSTDLAVQLGQKIREGDLNAVNKDLYVDVATKTSQMLNKDKSTLWYETIKVGDDKKEGRIISINAFYQSIFPIVQNYVKDGMISIAQRDDTASELAIFISQSWRLIKDTWPECFINSENKYNIQKGIGAYSLHMILGEMVENSNGNLDRALELFKELINNSQVKASDWRIGGRFSSYNSKSGFQKIASYIKNEISTLD